jgi:hypothetical protein
MTESTPAKRVTFSHADCTHEKTSKARAQCRADRAAASGKPAEKKAPAKKAPAKKTTTPKAKAPGETVATAAA